MERGSSPSEGSRRASFCLAAVVLIALAAAACTAAASPSPSASASPSAWATPSAIPSGSGATSVPSLAALLTPDLATPTATPAPTDTPEENPTGSPTPPLPKGPLPSLGPVPTSTWTGLNWIAIPAGHYPAVPAMRNDEAGNANATLEGWSKGYVEFLWDPHLRNVTPWLSANGLTWQSGTNLDLSAWTADFKAFDAEDSDSGDHDSCWLEVRRFQEGPATLLLRARFDCVSGCLAFQYVSSDAMWVSPDGASWTPVDMTKTFGSGGVGWISGGSSGYIALGSAAGKTIAWVSSDGQTWTQDALPTNAVSVSDPVAYAGGFVLPGIVHVQNGHKSPESDDVCGGGSIAYYDQSKYEGVLWWSPDGTTWTPDTLSGTVGYSVEMTVNRIDDHTLVADEYTYGSDRSLTSEKAWLSKDGKTWTRLRGYPEPQPPIISGRDHGLLDMWSPTTAQDSLLCVINDKLDLVVVLKQTGDLPWWDRPQLALGPTGLLATGDGSRFWIGVPTAG